MKINMFYRCTYALIACLISASVSFAEINRSEALPEGWLNLDVKRSTDEFPIGSADYADGTFTVNGGGIGLFERTDQFHFVYQPVSGDVEIIAHLATTANISDSAYIGVMIRQSTTYNARFFFVGLKGGVYPLSLFRTPASTAPTRYETTSGTTANWLRIVRQGTITAAYYSSDGVNWNMIDTFKSFEFPSSYFAGLAVCSSNSEVLTTALFDNVIVRTPPAGTIPERGMYFNKTQYIDEVIPTYSDNSDQLPRPVLEGNPGWIDMYNKAWQLLFSHIRKPQVNSHFVSNYFDEAFDNTWIYQWDIIFMTMFGKYAHHIFPGIQSLDNFYCRQRFNGAIARMISEQNGSDYWSSDTDANFINPPLFSWAEVENFKVTGDKSRFAAILPVLEKYFEFVDERRNCNDTNHKLYWSNGQSSGMDNTPRDAGRPNTHWASDHQGWVDMSCQMVIQCNNIAAICDELGYDAKAEKYREKAAVIAERINQWLWNENDGLYYDVKVDGAQMTWKSIAAFWTMLAGVTSAEQDSAMIRHLKDPDSFWRDMVFPTLSATHAEYHPEGGYWLGAVWAPTNFAVIKGLEKIGADAFAKEASERYIEGLYQVYLQTGTLWENYAADKINGKFKQGVNDQTPPGDCRKDFVGWTGLGPISLLIENVLGFRADGVNKILVYDLRRTDRHGIENLHFSDITTSMITEDRNNNPYFANIEVTSDKPYTLRIVFEGATREYAISAGVQYIRVEASAIAAQTIVPVFRFFPSPTSDKLILETNLTATQQLNVQIFDSSGKKRLERKERALAGITNRTIALTALPKDVYLLCVQINGQKYSGKFVKE